MPHKIIVTGDGSQTLESETFGVNYHSRHGAVSETKHVFIEMGMRYKAVVNHQLNILEIGLGTGLNAFATFLETEKRNLDISYIGLEAFPPGDELIQQLDYPEAFGAEDQKQAFLEIHQSDWGKTIRLGDGFLFEKRQEKFEEADLESNHFDVIYYDAFAPTSQPHLWEEPILRKMFDSLKEEGVLVTYCAKGVFKRTLKSIGFLVEKLPGPPGKREMTRATKPKIES